MCVHGAPRLTTCNTFLSLLSHWPMFTSSPPMTLPNGLLFVLGLALAFWAGRRLERWMGPSWRAFQQRRANDARMHAVLRGLREKADARPSMPIAEAVEILRAADEFDPSMGDDGFDPLRLLVGNALFGDVRQNFTIQHGRLLDRLLREHHSSLGAKFADL
jgi:hypothetical protein